MSSNKGKIVDLALASIVTDTQNNITISKEWLRQLDMKVREIGQEQGITGGLTLERLKRAIKGMDLKVHEVTTCGLSKMRSMSWNVNKNSFA